MYRLPRHHRRLYLQMPSELHSGMRCCGKQTQRTQRPVQQQQHAVQHQRQVMHRWSQTQLPLGLGVYLFGMRVCTRSIREEARTLSRLLASLGT